MTKSTDIHCVAKSLIDNFNTNLGCHYWSCVCGTQI